MPDIASNAREHVRGGTPGWCAWARLALAGIAAAMGCTAPSTTPKTLAQVAVSAQMTVVSSPSSGTAQTLDSVSFYLAESGNSCATFPEVVVTDDTAPMTVNAASTKAPPSSVCLPADCPALSCLEPDWDVSVSTAARSAEVSTTLAIRRSGAPWKGAHHQQVGVLPGELTVHPGSYLAR